MKRGITKISLIIWIIAISGFVASTMHYHSDSLHCLEHNDEQHYTENDQLCPIGVVKKSQLVQYFFSVEVSLPELELITQPLSLLQASAFFSYKQTRAPPSLV